MDFYAAVAYAKELNTICRRRQCLVALCDKNNYWRKIQGVWHHNNRYYVIDDYHYNKFKNRYRERGLVKTHLVDDGVTTYLSNRHLTTQLNKVPS